MSGRRNFLDADKSVMENNLRFVKSDLEENLNQFFGGSRGNMRGNVAEASSAPPRDFKVVQPSPGDRFSSMSSSGFNGNNGNFQKFSNNSNRKPFENIKYSQNERPSFGNNDNRNYDSFLMSNNNNRNEIELGIFDDIRTFNDSQSTPTDCFPKNYSNEGTIGSNLQIKPPFGINAKDFGNLYGNKGGYYGGSGNSGNIETGCSNTFKMNSINGPQFGNDEGFLSKNGNARNFDRLSSNYAPQSDQRGNFGISGEVEQYGNDQQFDIPGGNDVVQQFENVDNIGPCGDSGIPVNHERHFSNYGNEGLRNNYIREDCLPRSISSHNQPFVGSNLMDEHLGTGEFMTKNYECFPHDNDIIDGSINDNFRTYDDVELRDHGEMARIAEPFESDYRFEEGFRSTSIARSDELYGDGVGDLGMRSAVDNRNSKRFMRDLREEVEEEEERIRRNKYQLEKDYRTDRNSYRYHKIENRRSHSVSREDSRRRRRLERDGFRSRENSPLTFERRSFNYRNERYRHNSPEIRGEHTTRKEGGRYGSRQHHGYSREGRNYERDLKFESTGSRSSKRNEELATYGRSTDRNRFNKRPIDQVGLSSHRSRHSRERTEVARNPRFHKKRDVSLNSSEDLRMTPTDVDKDSVSATKKKKEHQPPLDGHIKHEPEQYWREWWSNYAYIEKAIEKIDKNDEAVKPLLSFHCELTDLTLNDKVDGIFTRGTALIQNNLNINEMNYQNRNAFKLLKYKKLLEDSNYQKYLLPKELVLLRKTLRSLNNKCVLAFLYQSIIRRWDHSTNLVKLFEKGEAIKAKQARYLMKDKLFHYLVLDSIHELKKLTAEDWPGFDEFYKSLQ